jgi:hypothetical protein
LDPYSGFAWLARSRWGCCISSSFNIRTFRLFPAEELGDGETSGNWVFTGRAKAGKRKRVLGQELVIGRYVPGAHGLDPIIVGYYRDNDLIYVARVRNGLKKCHSAGDRSRRLSFTGYPRLTTAWSPRKDFWHERYRKTGHPRSLQRQSRRAHSVHGVPRGNVAFPF